jgi:hypothetical protein
MDSAAVTASSIKTKYRGSDPSACSRMSPRSASDAGSSSTPKSPNTKRSSPDSPSSSPQVGVYAGWRRGKKTDTTITVTATFFASFPACATVTRGPCYGAGTAAPGVTCYLTLPIERYPQLEDFTRPATSSSWPPRNLGPKPSRDPPGSGGWRWSSDAGIGRWCHEFRPNRAFKLAGGPGGGGPTAHHRGPHRASRAVGEVAVTGGGLGVSPGEGGLAQVGPAPHARLPSPS